MPANWPSFEVILKLDGREVTLYWQRGEQTSIKPDLTVRAGEIVRLTEIPVRALIVVWSAI